LSKVYIISELCGQWGGSTAKAKQMITQSKQGGADAVKVQLWDTYRMPGENREKWEYLTMTREQFLDLKDYAESLELDYFASPFHRDRFKWITQSGLGVNKIASSMLEWDLEFCKDMVDTGMKTYCSLGKWESEEAPFESDNVVYFHCVAKYPHTAEEALQLMPEKFEGKLLGYSDHTIGIEAPIEAINRGAKIIEKHFTLNHNLQCDTESAHICSMNLEQLKEIRLAADQK
jgi:N,N'-diacetyllegionaminate synthase